MIYITSLDLGRAGLAGPHGACGVGISAPERPNTLGWALPAYLNNTTIDRATPSVVALFSLGDK